MALWIHLTSYLRRRNVPEVREILSKLYQINIDR